MKVRVRTMRRHRTASGRRGRQRLNYPPHPMPRGGLRPGWREIIAFKVNHFPVVPAVDIVLTIKGVPWWSVETPSIQNP